MKKFAFIMSIVLCFGFCSGSLALVEKPNETFQVDLTTLDSSFNFEAYMPCNTVVVRITGVSASDSHNSAPVSCKYKIESTINRDTKDMPKLDILGTNVKKGDRFVIILFGRHIAYWGDSFTDCAKFKIEGNNIILTSTESMSIKELSAKLKNLKKPALSIADQVEGASLVLEGRVADISSDYSSDYGFASIKPVKIYKGNLSLEKNIEMNPYRQLKKGKTYIFFLKEGSSDLPGDAPALFAVDKEAQFTIATSKLRKEVQKILAAQQ